MKYNYTEDLRQALLAAREQALRLGHDYVGTEHLLLGVLDATQPQEPPLLRALGIRASDVRQQLERAVRAGTAVASHGELAYTSRSKKTLEYAMAEGRRLGAEALDSSYLLLGLLLEEHGIASVVLRGLGARVEEARERVRTGFADPGEDDSFRVVIDEASDRSIYEQIVARVQEAVATGMLQPGERLPTVRRLADELDIAPGTVARAYGELERLGVIVTEGARGTRVAERNPTSTRQAPDVSTLAGLLRPVAVAAFHMGARAADLRRALEEAMAGILDEPTSRA